MDTLSIAVLVSPMLAVLAWRLTRLYMLPKSASWREARLKAVLRRHHTWHQGMDPEAFAKLAQYSYTTSDLCQDTERALSE